LPCTPAFKDRNTTATTTLLSTTSVWDTHSATTGIVVLTSATSFSIPVSSSSSSSNIGIIVGAMLAVISVTITIITIAVNMLVVWKRKRSVSTKPEDENHSTIDVRTLQASIENKQQKPEPLYSEIGDQLSSLKNISNASSTKESVTIAAYSISKHQVVLKDDHTNSCYSVKGQEVDPAYYPVVVLQPNNPAHSCDSNPKDQAEVENDPAYYYPMVKLQDNLAHFNPKNQVVLPAYGNTSKYKKGKE